MRMLEESYSPDDVMMQMYRGERIPTGAEQWTLVKSFRRQYLNDQNRYMKDSVIYESDDDIGEDTGAVDDDDLTVVAAAGGEGGAAAAAGGEKKEEGGAAGKEGGAAKEGQIVGIKFFFEEFEGINILHRSKLYQSINSNYKTEMRASLRFSGSHQKHFRTEY